MVRIFSSAVLILVASFGIGFTQELVTSRDGGVEIVPFENLSRQPDDNWTGTGVAHAIAADLAPTPGEARWLVRGTYQRVGDQLRITADLVGRTTGQS